MKRALKHYFKDELMEGTLPSIGKIRALKAKLDKASPKFLTLTPKKIKAAISNLRKKSAQ